MAQFNKNDKVYAGNSGVSMFENAEKRGVFSKASPDVLNPCITHYRKYLGEQQESQEPYKSLTFLPYVNSPIIKRIWLPESYIGIAT
ncbi:hypothetical protein LV89_00521 [Arcicella aurantiaca]|uniref:Uncharacterized protein n=1 Tax=Arcicella aurantiaca TaxID=591202 RepID=A0A316EGY3_9BACT|nr:hypothetical protein [Arcicella aurantiaca]PWK28968.1 hypothetical protein LV89_00521 [Arcicella aurantiaca]